MAEETLAALHSGEVVTPEENLELGEENPDEGLANPESDKEPETETGDVSESGEDSESGEETEAEPAAERKRKFKKVKR